MSKIKIIADSGSTKTDWVIVNLDSKETKKIRTIGFNPYFQNSDLISQEVRKGFEPLNDLLNQVDEVIYYGAGCSSSEKNIIIERALSPIFTNAKIKINHDLSAAAMATLGDESGIACIIGTGSNSCLWESNKVTANIPSHGYIFGDEASGAYLGKELLKLYLSDNLAEELVNALEHRFKTSKEEILYATYRGKSPNVFLANFAVFFSEHKAHPQIEAILREGFRTFFDIRIIPYKDYKNYPLGFVGSIAFYFQDLLIEIAKDYGVEVKTIVQCPIDNLVSYHSK
ncbi:MAG: hypothetical protein ACPG4W_05815 [Flavobacteriales bacterium]